MGLRPFLLLSYKVRTVWTLYTFLSMLKRDFLWTVFYTAKVNPKDYEVHISLKVSMFT